MIECNNKLNSPDKLAKIIESNLHQYHFKIHNAYNLTVPLSWSIPERINEDYNIVFIKGGSGHYYINGTKIPIERGKIIFISNYLPHSAEQKKSDPPIMIAVRFGLYNNITNLFTPGIAPPFSFNLIPLDIQKYQGLFESLYKYYTFNNSSIANCICNSIICQILSELYVILSNNTGKNSMDDRLEKSRLFIENTVPKPVTLKQLADIAGLSPKYFSRLFAKQYELTPREYMLKARMNYARFLLEESLHNIKEIALALGYSDQYIFSNQFKKVFGYPPSKVKNSKSSSIIY